MKILIAPAAMKGSLSALRFADAIEEGLLKSGWNLLLKHPIADGGDDTADVLAKAMNARFIPCRVHDPLGREIEAGFYLNEEGIAIVEMAKASGLALLKPHEYDPLHTSTFGTGECIKAAVAAGAKRILIGLGGSATVDGGMGALMALGVKFYNGHQALNEGDGEQTGQVVAIDATPARQLLKDVRLDLLADVENPLLGSNGAVDIYASQKGATSFVLNKLRRNMALFAGALFQYSGTDISSIAGGGAAGGFAASFQALLGANIEKGAPFILNETGFYALAKDCEVLITGEGILDETSLSGKATGKVLNFGMKFDKKVFAICGTSKLQGGNGFETIYQLVDQKVPVEMAMNKSYELTVINATRLGEKLYE